MWVRTPLTDVNSVRINDNVQITLVFELVPNVVVMDMMMSNDAYDASDDDLHDYNKFH